jgi:hypothetical protein
MEYSACSTVRGTSEPKVEPVEPWVIVIIVIAILLALAGGWLRKLKLRSNGQEASVEGPPSGRFKSDNSEFKTSKVKGRGADIRFKDSNSRKSRFDIR